MGNIVKGLLNDGAKLTFPVGVWGVFPRKIMHNMSKTTSCLQLQRIVIDPSAPDAFVDGIMEGVEWIKETVYLDRRD